MRLRDLSRHAARLISAGRAASGALIVAPSSSTLLLRFEIFKGCVRVGPGTNAVGHYMRSWKASRQLFLSRVSSITLSMTASKCSIPWQDANGNASLSIVPAGPHGFNRLPTAIARITNACARAWLIDRLSALH